MKRIPGWVRTTLNVVVALVLIAALTVGSIWWYLHPTVERTNGIVYGQRHGMPLTFDIVKPPSPNGLGIILMASGNWKSRGPGSIDTYVAAPVLRRGYTVFMLGHISQPISTVMETVADINYGIRYIRHHAREYGVDPSRFGITGGSSGGHLSLMISTRGGPGDPNSPDPVARESSAVQATAIFFPVTDLLNLGPSTENPGDGGPPIHFLKAFGFEAQPKAGTPEMDLWKNQTGYQMSPINYINPQMPPVYIVHGDKDTLVPLEQSLRFQARAAELGQRVVVDIHKGGKHGWYTMPWDIRTFGQWFDDHLKNAPAASGSKSTPHS